MSIGALVLISLVIGLVRCYCHGQHRLAVVAGDVDDRAVGRPAVPDLGQQVAVGRRDPAIVGFWLDQLGPAPVGQRPRALLYARLMVAIPIGAMSRSIC